MAGQYEVRVKKARGGPNVSAVTFTHKPRYDAANQAAGGYILRASHTDWPLEQFVRAYWQLADIEATFRTLKTDLGLRPIYHHKDELIERHLFLCVVAYHAVQFIRTELKRYKVNDNWGTLQQELQHRQRIVTTLGEKTGYRIINKLDRKLTDRQHKLATILGLDPRCHRARTRLEPAGSPNDYAPYKAA